MIQQLEDARAFAAELDDIIAAESAAAPRRAVAAPSS